MKKDNKRFQEQEGELRKNLFRADIFELDEAREKYILSLEPIIRKYAASYVAKGNGIIEFQDYVNEAFTRVSEQFDKFKFNSYPNVKLSTFMTWHIRDAMQILKTSTEQAYACATTNVKILSKIKKFMELYPKASLEEIENHFHVSKSRLISLLDSDKRSTSIFSSASNDDKMLLETFQDKGITSEEMTVLSKNKDELQRILISILSEREYHILITSFGLNKREETMTNIAKNESLSRQRIQQIKEEALRKIKNSNNSLFSRIHELLKSIVSIQEKLD